MSYRIITELEVIVDSKTEEKAREYFHKYWESLIKNHNIMEMNIDGDFKIEKCEEEE